MSKLRHATITLKPGYLLMIGRDRMVEQIITATKVDQRGRTTLEITYKPDYEDALKCYATHFQRTDDSDEMKDRLEVLERKLSNLASEVLSMRKELD